MLPTHRLSPKNQVTVPRDCRALSAAGDVPHLRGRPEWIRADDGKILPYVLLLTESELQRREQAILSAAGLDGEQKMKLITKLNGSSVAMALDGQNRIVLAGHLVDHLKLGDSRDIFFNSANSLIQVWNPEHYRVFDPGSAPDPDLARFLAI